MAEVLDQSEVDALLAAVEGGEVEVEAPVEKAERQVNIYDFKRPEKVSKDQLRSLEMLHEVYARNLGASLSAFLRTIVEIKLEAIDQLTYSEFIMSLPNPTCFNLLSCSPLEGNMILEVNPSIVFPIIDRLLGGGRSSSPPPDRALTDIEWRLVQTIIDRSLEQLAAVWEPIRKIEFQITTAESNPQLIQVEAPNEPVVLICFDISMGEHSGMMNLCIPYRVIEPVMAEIASHTWVGYARRSSPAQSASMADGLAGAELELRCFLAETSLTVRDIMALEPGDIVQLEKPCDSPLLVYVAERPKFLARPGIYRRHRAAKIIGIYKEEEQ
jgi:flagellar motor switch protein FliM